MSSESMKDRAERLKREAEEAKKNADKKDMVKQLSHQKEADTDFAKIAEEFTRRLADNKKDSANDKHVKDTIYIEEDLYRAFSALCVNRGDKKLYVNMALRDFVLKKYRELSSGKDPE